MMNEINPVNKSEYKAIIATAGIFSFRMLGLFMILPVFSLYAKQFTGATPFLIGMALGIYGLTQALLQIPFGTLSDYFPRKNIIALGLVIFAMGSVIAALSHSIWGIILGRALQGAGAIGSASIALVADLTRDEQRSIAMAIVGIVIGLSFFIAMFLGPLFNHWLGLSGIFWFSALLGLCGIFILYSFIPTPARQNTISSNLREQFKPLITNVNLAKLNIGIFCLHAILTASFIAVPLFLKQVIANPWKAYLATLFISIVIMMPLLRLAEKKQQQQLLMQFSMVLLMLSLFSLWLWHQSLYAMLISLAMFFTAFNVLEASLPSMISRTAPSASRGSAMGIYSSCQFLGIFIGGVLGGWLYSATNPATILFSCAIMAGLLLIITTLKL